MLAEIDYTGSHVIVTCSHVGSEHLRQVLEDALDHGVESQKVCDIRGFRHTYTVSLRTHGYEPRSLALKFVCTQLRDYGFEVKTRF